MFSKISQKELYRYQKKGIKVEIGNETAESFSPQLRITSEQTGAFVFFQFSTQGGMIQYQQGKIAYEKHAIRHNFYVKKTGDVEYEILLEEAPPEGKFVIPLQVNKVRFFVIEIKGKSIPSMRRLRGAIIAQHKLASVGDGSSMEHETTDKKETKEKEEEVYERLFTLLRPTIIDAKGHSVYGQYLVKDDTLIIEIPQDFLQRAVFPIIIDPTFEIGSASAFETAGDASYGVSVAGLDKTHAVIVWKDKCCIATVSGTSISFGTTYTYEAGGQYPEVCRVTDSTFVIAYQQGSSKNTIKAIHGTVSGAAISFGSAAALMPDANTGDPDIDLLDPSHVVVCARYYAPSDNIARAVVVTISGSTLSPGTVKDLTASPINARAPRVAALSSSGFVVTFYDYDASSEYVEAVACTVSGTTISSGTATKLNSFLLGSHDIARIDGSSYLIAAHGAKMAVGTVSGTTANSISTVYTIGALYNNTKLRLCCIDSNLRLFRRIGLRHETDYNGYITQVKVSGTTVLEHVSDTLLASGFNSGKFDMGCLTDKRISVVGFADAGDSNYGKAIAVCLPRGSILGVMDMDF